MAESAATLAELEARLAFLQDSCDRHRREAEALAVYVDPEKVRIIRKYIWGE